MHDRDRIVYSRAFAALSGKTQVVASIEPGGFHTRLTHSLKVEQLGRRIAELLALQHPDTATPNPELVSAACLAHDLGHPPFGHAGEVALAAAVQRSSPGASFEGNAQNLRILSFLESRRTAVHRGLHLTRATLDAAIKYPWQYETKPAAEAPATPGPDRSKKFGVYLEDAAAATWVGSQEAPRPVEEEIMDWADDVTYACHDVEDFYRAGLIPLDDLIAFPIDPQWSRLSLTQQEPPELGRFLNYVSRKHEARGKGEYDRERALEWMKKFQSFFMGGNFSIGQHRDRARLNQTISQLITEFLRGIQLVYSAEPSGPLTRYNARLHIPDDSRFNCELIKELVWFYVIDNPILAGQQHGQQRIIGELFEWHSEDIQRLLPQARLEEYEIHKNPARACSDHIAGLTEQQALRLHQRMSGVDSGSILERAV